MDSNGSKQKGKGKAKMRDLMSFWSSGSSSNPISHVDAIAASTLEAEEQIDKDEQVDEEEAAWDEEYWKAVAAMEEEFENSVPAEQGQEEEEEEEEEEYWIAMAAEMEEVEQDGHDGGIITQFNSDHIISDPGLRTPIDQFSINSRDDIRRAFIAKGPTQPVGYNFPCSNKRSFNEKWFKKHAWLEYSVEKNKAYCFYCYLFKHDGLDDKFDHDAFTSVGFSTWKNAYKAFPKHAGKSHIQCRTAYEDFDNQRASVRHKVTKYTKDARVKYETRLDPSLGIVRFLSLQGEPFRGHDETSLSMNKGNFLEMLDWYKERNEQVRLAFDEACPKNAQETSPTIQKELAECCAAEITRVIKQEMACSLFSVLIDESRDISIKEQMAVVVRFVNHKGNIIERFLSIKHVKETTAAALKGALVEVLGNHGLHIANLRGQGYDGVSNMRGEFNGLQKIIRDENPYAFYIHCFAHQLQLVVVSVSRCCSSIEDFFEYVTLIVNTTSSSCKRKEILLDSQRRILLSKLKNPEIVTGRRKHQATSLARPGDTRWGSHYKTLLRIESMWESVVEVLEIVQQDGRNPCRAGGLVQTMESFSFVFIMKMMMQILRITNELSLILQRKDQNVV